MVVLDARVIHIPTRCLTVESLRHSNSCLTFPGIPSLDASVWCNLLQTSGNGCLLLISAAPEDNNLRDCHPVAWLRPFPHNPRLSVPTVDKVDLRYRRAPHAAEPQLWESCHKRGDPSNETLTQNQWMQELTLRCNAAHSYELDCV